MTGPRLYSVCCYWKVEALAFTTARFISWNDIRHAFLRGARQRQHGWQKLAKAAQRSGLTRSHGPARIVQMVVREQEGALGERNALVEPTRLSGRDISLTYFST